MGIAEKFDINPDKIPLYKITLHGVQGILALVIFILEIVLFTGDGSKINGDNAWPFGLCFLSIPALLYLGLTPRFERTRRAAQPHVMVVLDTLFAIFWLSAFASQAAYNTANDCGKSCSVSKAVVGFAFFEIVAWILTTAISVYTLRYYQSNGELPGYDKLVTRQNIDPDKAAFSSALHDEEAYAPVNMDDHHDDHHDPFSNDHRDESPYGGGGSGAGGGMYETESSYRPQHTTSPGPNENPFGNNYRTHGSPSHDPFGDNAYGEQHNINTGGAGPHIYAPPAAEDYDENQPVHFPSADYDRTLH
ncbi:hypothetical protein F5Y16DRAFT_367437 [Xylariaceae sp. FL0255]|nr:hypothetical protein F5Y16DRAFT_367437 [Xylariaceae sp. FL0255]